MPSLSPAWMPVEQTLYVRSMTPLKPGLRGHQAISATRSKPKYQSLCYSFSNIFRSLQQMNKYKFESWTRGRKPSAREKRLHLLHPRVQMIKFRVLLFPMLLSLSCTAFAQVYKSTDAEGNVTYSDTPSTGSEAVQVEKTNVADPVKVPENLFESPPPAPEVVKQQAQPEVTVENRDDDDGYLRRGRAARKIERHRRYEHRRR